MSRNIEEEILKNSKYAKFFYSNDVEANKSKLNISNNKQNEQSLKNEDLNCSTNLKKQIEDKKLDESFKKLRQNNPQVLADFEAEEYIQNLRDIGEYNRWSLRLVQKWLTGFYTGKKIKYLKLYLFNYRQILGKNGFSYDEIQQRTKFRRYSLRYL